MTAIHFPSFNTLDLDTFPKGLDDLLETNLNKISTLLTQKNYTWDNLMYPLEDLDDAIERLWSPLSHKHAVVNSQALRDCYQKCLPKLSAYSAAVGQNIDLYNAIKSINASLLNPAQQKIVSDALLDFQLSGVALSEEKKRRFEEIQTQLSDLSNQFENNVLDASQAFSFTISDAKQLSGLPAHAVEAAQVLAIEKKLDGWVLNLEIPCYLAVATYADDRSLRETFYHAYTTRASDQGPNAGEYDNTNIMNEMLALRHEKAQLLGFANYAELSLATKMADSTHQVVEFLLDLTHRAYQQAANDFSQIKSFAKETLNLEDIKPWDIAYISEKMRQQYYSISQETLRSYFPEDQVMTGLFKIIHKLYGIRLQREDNVDVWHPDVACYRLIDDSNNARGFVYVDLFARQNKRGGAWMDSLQSRRRLQDGSIQLPIATLTCNFAKSSSNQPAIFSHDEVITLFHEFGHCLHHLLTKVDYLSASGINGVEWDAVELPSQIFENWCWEREALQLLSRHIETNEALPNDLYEKLLAAKNFQSAMGMMRQLEFSLFDFRIHQEYTADDSDFIAKILAQVRQKTLVIPTAAYNRFQHSFTHIFSGGYCAGYYSYKWAEVLSSDAYARFEEEGIFNTKTGRDFLHAVLEVGGSKNAAEAFKDFRGRPAQVDALLRHNGIQ